MRGFNPQWLAALRAGSKLAPLRPRLPLLVGQVVIGSVEPDFLRKIELPTLPDRRKKLSKEERPEGPVWHLRGEPTAGLQALAFALREAGMAHAWRDEQLAVADPQGLRIATVERAVVRVLGIPTHAVHLVGQTEGVALLGPAARLRQGQRPRPVGYTDGRHDQRHRHAGWRAGA